MTEEEVVNVRGEISHGGVEDNADRHPESKVSCCNGVSHVSEKQKQKEEADAVVFDNGGGKVDGVGSSDFVGGCEAVAVSVHDDDDSSVSDLNVVVDNDDNGAAASEGLKLQLDLEHKVDDGGEPLDESSQVLVSISVSEAAEVECEGEREQIDGTAKDFTDASAVSSGVVEEIYEKDVDNSTISVDADADGENVERESVSVSAEECEAGENRSGEEKAQIGCVENVRSVDADVSGNEKDVVTVVQGVADVNQSHELEKLVDAHVQNGVAENELSEGAEENEIPVAADVKIHETNGVVVADEELSEGAEENIHVDVDGASAVDLQIHESNGVVGADVQNGLADRELSERVEEKEIPDPVESVSAADVKIHESNGVVGTDVQNGLADRELSERVEENEIPDPAESVSATDVNKIHESMIGTDDVKNILADTELSECANKENEIPVIVDGVSATDVEKFQEFNDVVGGADEDTEANSGAEKAQFESIFVTDLNETPESDSGGGEEEKARIDSVSVKDLTESPECDSGDGDKEDVGTVADRRSESVSVTDIQNGLAETELSECAEANEVPTEGEPGSKLESFEEKDSGNELVPEGENLLASSSTDIPEDGNVKSDVNVNAVVSEGEPSVGIPDNGVENGDHGDGDLRPTKEGSTADILDEQDGQNMGAEVEKKPFFFLIRLPRYDDDENLKDQIKNALHQVEEKTKSRDAIRAEIQIQRASCKECGQEVRAAVSGERAARDLLKSKRQEMDSVQSTMNRLNNAISVEDIDGRIKNMEHMIEHETLPLKEEKQLLRQIKQLKQNREELSSNMGTQDQLQQPLDDRDIIEEQFQRLRRDMESLRQDLLNTEAVTKAARKKYDDENNKLSELLARFKAADDIRQEAYVKLQALKKQLYEKNQYFWDYKNAANKGHELAAEGKKEELQCLCVNQVERIMELWNRNDEFRREYIRCNTRSTLRRLRTQDGRSLGPDEEPPVIPNAVAERAPKKSSLLSQSTLEQEKESISPEIVNIKEEPVSTVVVQKSQTTKAKKPAKPAPVEKKVSSWADEVEAEDVRQEPVRTKEEKERILKAEKAREEEEEAKLKEKRRLEEIEKAKEAMQRKKRNADKAQQKAALKAQREAEQKEKEREKKLRKKERRKAAATETAVNTEPETDLTSENLTSTEECDQSEKPAEVTKRVQKPSQFARQTKAKSIPPPLRNRGRRRIQPWMWVLITFLVVAALFFMGNNSSLRSALRDFGF